MPMGLATNQIQDNQISASGYLSESHLPQNARLMNTSNWIPSPEDPSPWLQISFKTTMVVSAIVLDGRLDSNIGWIWLDVFYITYSEDGDDWKPYQYYTKTEKVKNIHFKLCFFFSLESW